MNPIKINPYQPILRRLISGDLSVDISNIGRFFPANDMGEQFSHIASSAGKKNKIFKTVIIDATQEHHICYPKS